MKKTVKSTTTFLWKRPETNQVLEKIQQHSQTIPHTYLSKEDTMRLYKEKLVDSEVIFGTVVEVVTEKDGWAQVIVLDQESNLNEKGYPGYIPTIDLAEAEMSDPDAEKIAVIVAETELFLENTKQKIVFGTVLSLLKETDDRYVVVTPVGVGEIAKKDCQKTTAYKGNRLPERMRDLAEQFLDLPYVWSGISGSGFDCSGFVYSLHRVNNVLIPRDTIEQAQSGTHVSYQKALPGDLLLFGYEEGKGEIHHVGLYIGNDEMIHSQTPGSKVMKTKISQSKYEPELAVVARYWV